MVLKLRCRSMGQIRVVILVSQSSENQFGRTKKKCKKKKHFKLVFKSEPLLPEKFLDAFMDFLREIHTKNEVSQIIKDEL